MKTHTGLMVNFPPCTCTSNMHNIAHVIFLEAKCVGLRKYLDEMTSKIHFEMLREWWCKKSIAICIVSLHTKIYFATMATDPDKPVTM